MVTTASPKRGAMACPQYPRGGSLALGTYHFSRPPQPMRSTWNTGIRKWTRRVLLSVSDHSADDRQREWVPLRPTTRIFFDGRAVRAADAPLSCSAAGRPGHPCPCVRRHAAHPAFARHGDPEARLRVASRAPTAAASCGKRLASTFNHTADDSYRESVPVRPSTRSRPSDIERPNLILVHKLQDLLRGRRWLHNPPRINQHIRPLKQRTQIPRQACSTRQRLDIENRSSVTIDDIQPRPLPVTPMGQRHQRVLVGYRPVLRCPILRTPPPTRKTNGQRRIQSTPIHTGVPSRNNLDECP